MSHEYIPVDFTEATHALSEGYAIKTSIQNGPVFFKLGRSLMATATISKKINMVLDGHIETPSEIVKVVDKKIVARFDKVEEALKDQTEFFKCVDRGEHAAYLATQKEAPSTTEAKVEVPAEATVVGVDRFLKPA